MFKHILTASQFSPQAIEVLFRVTEKMERRWYLWKTQMNKRAALEDVRLEGIGMYSLFYEPSLRTRFSFETAMRHLGGSVLASTESAGQFSSAAKGENLADTIRTLCQYGPHLIVLRHPENGSAEEAAAIAEEYGISIINAGDGNNEHPTQALLDLYTIYRLLTRLDHFSIAFMGDIANSRTVRSLALLLANYPGITMYFCAPKLTQLQEDMRAKLTQTKMEFYEVGEGWRELISAKKIQFLYQTRIQAERFTNQEMLAEAIRLQPSYTITEEIGELMEKQEIYLMHPLPRVKEIHVACDRFSTSIYFEKQVKYGLLIRMALLAMMFSNKFQAVSQQEQAVNA